MSAAQALPDHDHARALRHADAARGAGRGDELPRARRVLVEELRVARDADESDELWRLITDYFGEEDDLEPAWAAAPHPAAAAAAPPPSDAVGIEPSQPAVSAEDEIPF